MSGGIEAIELAHALRSIVESVWCNEWGVVRRPSTEMARSTAADAEIAAVDTSTGIPATSAELERAVA